MEIPVLKGQRSCKTLSLPVVAPGGLALVSQSLKFFRGAGTIVYS